jgi:hypothetical protein
MSRVTAGLWSVVVGGVAYVVVSAIGIALIFASLSSDEPNPPWADDRLPAEAVEAVLIPVKFGLCQVVACPVGVVVVVSTYCSLIRRDPLAQPTPRLG